MPFKSEKQRRFLWAAHPDIAKRWAHEYPESNRNLPPYARKTDVNKTVRQDKDKEAAVSVLRNSLKTLEIPGNTQNMKAATSILSYLNVPQSDKPVAAGEEPVTPAGTALGPDAQKPVSATTATPEKDPNEPPYENIPHGNKAGSSNAQEDSQNSQILREMAPILKKMGEAFEDARNNLCRSISRADLGPGLEVYARAVKGAAVVKPGRAILQELENSLGSIPDPLQRASQFNTSGLNLKLINENVNSEKRRQFWAQNPLPLGAQQGNGQNSPNSGPFATNPGMQNPTKPAAPGAVNPMLAGSNASTSPIQHGGAMKSQDGKLVMGPKALLGNGQAGFGGGSNLHGLEKIPGIPELATGAVGIPRIS